MTTPINSLESIYNLTVDYNDKLKKNEDISKELKAANQALNRYIKEHPNEKMSENVIHYKNMIQLDRVGFLIHQCENQWRDGQDPSKNFKKALKTLQGYINKHPDKLADKELADLKTRFKSICSEVETGTLAKVWSRIRNLFVYGTAGFGRTTKGVLDKVTRNIDEPKRTKFAADARSFEDKLAHQTQSADDQFAAEVQAKTPIGKRRAEKEQLLKQRNEEAIQNFESVHGRLPSEEEKSNVIKSQLDQVLSEHLPHTSFKSDVGESLLKDVLNTHQQNMAPTISRFGNLGAGCSTIGDKPEQEDAYIMTQLRLGTSELPFYAVYDGHHGDQVSTFLQQNLHERIQENFEGFVEFDEEAFLDAVISAFDQVNEEICSNKGLKTAGSTAICTIRHNDDLYTFSTGDACALLLDKGSNRTIPLNELAKADDERFQKGLKRLGGAQNTTKTKLIGRGGQYENPRAFGDSDVPGTTPRPKVTKQRIPENAALFLSSDGPFQHITRKTVGKEAIKLLNKEGASLEDVAVTLLEKSYKSGSQDNITILLADLS